MSRYPPILDEMLPLADEAAKVVAEWWLAKSTLNGEPATPLDADLVAVIGQAAFSALQRFASLAKMDLVDNQYAAAIEFLERELLKAEHLAESIRYSLTVLREKGRLNIATALPPQRGGS